MVSFKSTGRCYNGSPSYTHRGIRIDGLREPHPKHKNLVFQVWASDKATPSLSILTYNYNSMLTYIRVSFWFFSKKRFGLVIGLGLGLVFVLGLRLGFRFEFGFGKLIGGAVGTVGLGSRKPPWHSIS